MTSIGSKNVQQPPYQTDGVRLNGGLNYTDPKIFLEPGTLSDCLNYETQDRTGYRRIDGFERFDGRVTGVEDTYTIFDGLYGGTVLDDYPVGSVIEVDGSNSPFGIVVGTLATIPGPDLTIVAPNIIYAKIDGGQEPGNGDIVSVSGGSSGTFTANADPITLKDEYDFLGIQKTFVDDNNSYNDNLRSQIGDLPNPAVGLHWFHDRLYAFADEDIAFFNSGSTQLYPGDLIQDSGGTNTFRVVDIRTTSGTWGGGDAAGALMVEILTGSVQTSGDITCTRPNSTTLVNVATFADSSAATATYRVPWKAGLWETRDYAQAIADGDDATDAGWNKLNTGILLNFTDGNFSSGDLPVLDRKTGLIDIGSVFDNTGNQIGVFNTAYYNFNIAGDATASGSTTVDATVAAGSDKTTPAAYVEGVEADDAYFLRLGFQASDNGGSVVSRRLGYTACAELQDVPAYARITGVEVILTDVTPITAEASAGNYFGELELEVGLFKYGGTPTQVGSPKLQSFTNENGVATAAASYTLGSSTDLWGETEIAVNDILDANFGVSLKFEGSITSGANSVGGTAGYFLSVDQIQVKVYYELEFSRYYFWDGVDDVQADLISYFVASGDFETGNAAGVMQVANVTEVGSAVRRSIKPGDEIHVATGGNASSLVGVVGSAATDVTVNAPASFTDIQTANSRYQFITANFYADDTYDAVYGVTGASRAFEFDGSYLVQIYTQEDDDKDKPRHVAFHHYHLALGYRGGQVLFSVVGEPTNYDGVLGATEIAVGDRITGLLRMRGAALGVFCENSIHAINGTISDQFATQVLAPSTGAIEYTVIDMGLPVYCDARGISTLDQSQKYGDFQGQRLSYPISPWILPRMLSNKSTTSAVNANEVVCAIPVRSKNQYRLFFRDGYVLVMTLNPDGTPAFTLSQYYIGASSETDTTKYMVPLASSSQADEDGKERIHVSHYSEQSDVTTANGKYVYELEKGWGFDGNFIPHFINSNWHFQADPFSYNTLRKVRLEGASKGFSPLNIYTSSDYETTYSTTGVDISLPRSSSSTTITSDFKPATNIASVAERGRSVSIKIKGELYTGDDVNDCYPPHILQALLIQFTPIGAKDV